MKKPALKPIILGCVGFVIGWTILTWSALQFMPTALPFPFRPVFGGLAGLAFTMSFFSVWGILRGQPSSMRTVDLAKTIAPPDDGANVIVTGTVRAIGTPLRAPFSGTLCVTYWYKVATAGHPKYTGYRSQPFAIETATRSHRVFAVPQLDFAGHPLTGADAVERARAYIASTPFETTGPEFIESLGAVFSQARDMFTDEDGEARRDFKHGQADIDGDDVLEETLLPTGTRATVTGSWSASQSAITIGDGSRGSLHVVVSRGRQQRDSDMPTYTQSVLAAIFSAAAGVGLIFLADYIVRTH